MTKHEELVKKWNAAKLGVKQRVKKDPVTPTQQTINNIISNPKHKDLETMQLIIDKIEVHSNAVLIESKQMVKKIENIDVIDSEIVKSD